MRALGIDLGRRRVGLAISDPSGVLARPLRTLTVTGVDDALDRLLVIVAELTGSEDGLDAIVVGMPGALDGSSTAESDYVARFVRRLRERTAVVVATEDERLTSREAESRLALRERDWRARKKKLDAAAAAIVLQDYLDRRMSSQP